MAQDRINQTGEESVENRVKDVDILISEINAAFAKGQTREGTLLADQAVKQYPHDAAIWILRGQLNQHNGHLLAARQDLEKAYVLQPDNPSIVKRLFIILEQLNDYTAVRKLLDEAVERLPHDGDLYLTVAEVNSKLGDFQAAKAMTLRVLKDSPDHAGAIYNLAVLGEGELAGGLDKVEALMEKTSSSSTKYNKLNYARARMLEQGKAYEQAFAAYEAANAQQAAAGGMQIKPKLKGAGAVINELTAEVVARFSGNGNESERPVFIIGMPRSGTTLTEQILAAHPDVYAAGEKGFWPSILRGLIVNAPRRGSSMAEAISCVHPDVWKRAGDEYLRRMNEINATSKRVTDKLPVNFALLPYIRLIFPRSRIIHLRREPLATLISCIRSRFNQPTLAFTIEDWAHFYGMYLALMDHWRTILGDQLLEINYEDLVSDLPKHAHSLITFLGLEWHEDCLHPERHKRAVATASVMQVRQSVHTRAINAWRHYETQLETLRPLIAESRAAVAQCKAGV